MLQSHTQTRGKTEERHGGRFERSPHRDKDYSQKCPDNRDVAWRRNSGRSALFPLTFNTFLTKGQSDQSPCPTLHTCPPCPPHSRALGRTCSTLITSASPGFITAHDRTYWQLSFAPFLEFILTLDNYCIWLNESNARLDHSSGCEYNNSQITVS